MLVFDDRLQDRRRANFSMWAKRVRSFHHGPAIVPATLDMEDRFPQILTHVAGQSSPVSRSKLIFQTLRRP